MDFTFDSTDPAVAEQQQAAESKALAEGERLIAEQAKSQQDTYDKAREAEESQLRYAGKYKSAEDLEKAYLEAQRKISELTAAPDESVEGGSEPTQDDPEEASTPEEDESEPQEIKDTAELLQNAAEEFTTGNSKLSKETIDRLSQIDSRTLVETWQTYIVNKQTEAEAAALSQQEADRVLNAIGGQQVYTDMLAWAANNMSPSEVAAYDSVINSNNPEAVYWAALGLKAKYTDSVGYEGNQVSGKRSPAKGDAFRSHAELARAINNPKYRDDPAYRRDVEEKLARSGELL
jgi:hypothetical protein